MTHAGNVKKWRRESPVSVAWFVWRGLQSGKLTVAHVRSKRQYCVPLEDRPTCFCSSWRWPFTFWSQNKLFSRHHRGTYLCQVWWSFLHEFLRYCMEKQTNTRLPLASVNISWVIKEWPRDDYISWSLVNSCTVLRKIAFEKAGSSWINIS